MLLAVASIALAVAGCAKKDTAAEPSAATLRSLTIDQVATRIAAKDGKTFIFDDNNQARWAQGHVPTATWLDEDSVTTTALPPNKAATLIFYCHSET
jgi:hypothetical protein